MDPKSWILLFLGYILSIGSSVDVAIESEFTALFDSNVLSASVDISLTADIDISSALSYEIPGGLVLSITSSGSTYQLTRLAGTKPFFLVSSGGTLMLSVLDISSYASANGAAVAVEQGGLLTASEVVFQNCNSTGLGGSIYNEGTARLNSTDFRGGFAQVSGGGIYATNTSVTEMEYATFRSLSAVLSDGGAIVTLGLFTLDHGKFVGNFAKYHGGDIKIGKFANFSASHCTFTDSFVSLGSGGSIHSLGASSLTSTRILRPYAYAKGGGISVLDGEFVVNQVVVVDANLDTGSGSSQGGGMYIGTAGTVVKGTGLTFNNSDVNVNMGPHFDLGKGGGVYLDLGTVMNITDFSCDGIAAANGPCIFAFTASFTLIGGTVTRCFGFDEANQAAAVYLDSDGWGSLTDVHFISNRLHPLNSAQKGAAIYMLASELVMNRVSFFNHSSIGNGGSVYAESLSLITAKDINVTYSKALTGLGGFLYADDSSVTINGITASHCKAVPDSSSGGGQGGVIAANAGYKLILKNGYYYDNEANQGGAIYINQLFDSPVVTTTDDYFGAQIYDSVFERNNATIGGAIYGKQSIFYATRSRFTNNFATTFEGSAIFMATDTILQFSTVETSIESYSNATMIEAVRLALDNSTVSTNMGFGIKLSSDTGDEDTDGRYRDKTYYILSRNSDLSGTRITDSLGNGYWATLSCLDSSGDREEWYPENTIPSLGSAGVTFQPACPTSAQCVEDSDLKTMLCTCDSSSFHSNIYNSDGSCLDSGATLAPSPLPTVTGGNDDVSGTDDTSSLANTTYAITDNSKVLNVGFDMSTDVMILLYASLGLLGLVLFLSSAVDCAKFEGASEDSLQDRTLFVMSKVPALFHLLLCTNRKHWVDLVVAYEDVVEVEQESSNPLSGKKGRKKEGRKSTRKRRTKKGKDLADEHSPFATGDGTQAPKRKTKKETAGEHQSLL